MPSTMNPAVRKMIVKRKPVWVILPVGQLPGNGAIAVGPFVAVAREHPRRAAVEAAWGKMAVL